MPEIRNARAADFNGLKSPVLDLSNARKVALPLNREPSAVTTRFTSAPLQPLSVQPRLPLPTVKNPNLQSVESGLAPVLSESALDGLYSAPLPRLSEGVQPPTQLFKNSVQRTLFTQTPVAGADRPIQRDPLTGSPQDRDAVEAAVNGGKGAIFTALFEQLENGSRSLPRLKERIDDLAQRVGEQIKGASQIGGDQPVSKQENQAQISRELREGLSDALLALRRTVRTTPAERAGVRLSNGFFESVGNALIIGVLAYVSKGASTRAAAAGPSRQAFQPGRVYKDPTGGNTIIDVAAKPETTKPDAKQARAQNSSKPDQQRINELRATADELLRENLKRGDNQVKLPSDTSPAVVAAKSTKNQLDERLEFDAGAFARMIAVNTKRNGFPAVAQSLATENSRNVLVGNRRVIENVVENSDPLSSQAQTFRAARAAVDAAIKIQKRGGDNQTLVDRYPDLLSDDAGFAMQRLGATNRVPQVIEGIKKRNEFLEEIGGRSSSLYELYANKGVRKALADQSESLALLEKIGSKSTIDQNDFQDLVSALTKLPRVASVAGRVVIRYLATSESRILRERAVDYLIEAGYEVNQREVINGSLVRIKSAGTTALNQAINKIESSNSTQPDLLFIDLAKKAGLLKVNAPGSDLLSPIAIATFDSTLVPSQPATDLKISDGDVSLRLNPNIHSSVVGNLIVGSNPFLIKYSNFNGSFGFSNEAIKDPIVRAEDRARNATQFLVNQKIRVVNISYDFDLVGRKNQVSEPDRIFYDTVIRDNPNVVFVASTGNERKGSSNLRENMDQLKLSMAKKYPNVLLVAATSGPGGLARYSGAGRPLTNIAAPGETRAADRFGFRPFSLFGTSFAAPRVSAAVVKVLTLSDLSPIQVRTLIEASGTGPDAVLSEFSTQATNGGELQSDLAIQSAALIRQLKYSPPNESFGGIDEAFSRAGLDQLPVNEKLRVLEIADKVLNAK
jgi:Subtilase family